MNGVSELKPALEKATIPLCVKNEILAGVERIFEEKKGCESFESTLSCSCGSNNLFTRVDLNVRGDEISLTFLQGQDGPKT